jgi:hypothetical protein
MSKEQLENFRALQYASPHPGQLHPISRHLRRTDSATGMADEDRVILHFDVSSVDVALFSW